MFSTSEANISAPGLFDPDAIKIEVGQMWKWNFNVGEGWWLLQAVSDAARREWKPNDNEVIRKNDVFIVVCTDDSGPAPAMKENWDQATETWTLISKPARHHVVLFHDRLVWIKHSDLSICKLVET